MGFGVLVPSLATVDLWVWVFLGLRVLVSVFSFISYKQACAVCYASYFMLFTLAITTCFYSQDNKIQG